MAGAGNDDEARTRYPGGDLARQFRRSSFVLLADENQGGTGDGGKS